MQKIAVQCASGIGDALLMLIASETWKQRGASVTTLTPHYKQLSPLFPHHHLAPRGPIDPSYDLIILQNDNQSLHLIKTDRERLSIFYPTYEAHRHPPLSDKDVPFNPRQTMVKNIMQAVGAPNSYNGLVLDPKLIFRKYPHRTLIHPTSADPSHIYPRARFLKLAKKLQRQGREVHFIVAPHEKEAWEEIPYPLHAMSLQDLSSFLYESGQLIGNESGPAHLASNVGIPTIMIGSCPKRLKLWQPDFTPATALTPPLWIPNLKGFRLRTTYWHSFIPIGKVVRALKSSD
ncbi:MAG: hypothetical protein KBC64_07590 [Simkaniaceae bacterium]|nr:hypothetical protein [Simkaniaceae bacterium]